MLSETTRQALDTALSAATASPYSNIPSVVVLAASSTEVLYSGASGNSSLPTEPSLFDPNNTDKVHLDSIFSLWSATKLITTIAALQLYERGLFGLEDDVSKYIKELKDVSILEGFGQDGEPILRQKKERIEVRMLMNHTAGFTHSRRQPLHDKFLTYKGIPSCYSAEGTRESFLQVPLLYEPGSGWYYDGSSLWLGYLVESVTGEDLDTYFQKNIFAPLKINDMSFTVHPSVVNCAYVQGPDEPLKIDATRPLSGVPMGSAGLFGSASSYLKIIQAILKGDGPLLQPSTVNLMFQPTLDHLPNAARSDLASLATVTDPFAHERKEPVWDAEFGLGGMLLGHELKSGRSKGSMTWSGALGTFWSIDRENDLAFVYFTQITPFASHEPQYDLSRKVDMLLYKEIRESKAVASH